MYGTYPLAQVTSNCWRLWEYRPVATRLDENSWSSQSSMSTSQVATASWIRRRTLVVSRSGPAPMSEARAVPPYRRLPLVAGVAWTGPTLGNISPWPGICALRRLAILGLFHDRPCPAEHDVLDDLLPLLRVDRHHLL